MRLHYLPGTAAIAPHATLAEIGVLYAGHYDLLDAHLHGREWLGLPLPEFALA